MQKPTSHTVNHANNDLQGTEPITTGKRLKKRRQGQPKYAPVVLKVNPEAVKVTVMAFLRGDSDWIKIVNSLPQEEWQNILYENDFEYRNKVFGGKRVWEIRRKLATPLAKYRTLIDNMVYQK